jgi:hypothetical protein
MPNSAVAESFGQIEHVSRKRTVCGTDAPKYVSYCKNLLVSVVYEQSSSVEFFLFGIVNEGS